MFDGNKYYSCSVTPAIIGAEIYFVSGETGVVSDSISGVYHGLAVAVLSSGGAFVTGNKNNMVDFNHFHIFLAHSHSSVLKTIVQQHDTRPVGELAPCAGCSIGEGYTCATPRPGRRGQ